MSDQNNKKVCGQECKVYSRVVGYYTAVDEWNLGKQAEFKDRQSFSVDEKALIEDTVGA